MMVVFYVIHHRGSEKITIHALRGEGDDKPIPMEHEHGGISIHALRGEGDVYLYVRSRVPAGISIHALRGEGDLLKQ